MSVRGQMFERITGFSPAEMYAKAKELRSQGFLYSPGSIGWIRLASGRILFSADCIRPVAMPVRIVRHHSSLPKAA